MSSTDEHTFVSGVTSLVTLGRLTTNQSYNHTHGRYDVEPVHALVGTAFYWVSTALQLGVAHTLLFMNVFLSAMTGAVVFLYATRLDFSPRWAVAGALLFGFATMAWPYAQTYFRDVLASLLLLLAAYTLDMALEAGFRHPIAAWVLAAAFLVAGLFTKYTLVGALPGMGIAVIAAFSPRFRLTRRGLVWGALAALLTAVALGFALWQMPLTQLFVQRLALRVVTGLESLTSPGVARNFGPAVIGMLASPGKSVWLYSPIAALAPVSWFLTRGRRRRTVALALLVLAAFVVTHAVYLRGRWWGGVTWGLRGMLPTIPLLVLASLPACEALWALRARWGRVVLVLLVVLSVAVQVGAASVKLIKYYDFLGSVRPDAAATLALWDPQYSAILGHWRLLSEGTQVNFAWARLWQVNPGGAALALAATIVALLASGVAVALALRRPAAGVPAPLVALCLCAVAVAPPVMLHALDRDPAYFGNRGDFRAATDYVRANAQPGDVAIVRQYNYPLWLYIFNYARWPFDWYGVGDPEQDALGNLSGETAAVLQGLPPGTQRVWLLDEPAAGNGRLRREEAWLTRNLAPLESREFSDPGQVRVSLFASLPPMAPEIAVDARFGRNIVLDRVRLPEAPVQPGGALPVCLAWHLTGVESTDYTVGLYLLDGAGVLVSQQDMMPVNGFRPFTTWAPGEEMADNRGLMVPASLAPGSYAVMLAVYDPDTVERLPVTSARQAPGDALPLGAVVVVPRVR